MFRFLFDRNRQVIPFAIFYRPRGSDFVLRIERSAASEYEVNRRFDQEFPELQRVETIRL